jgi:hypothetical protein
MVLAFSNFSQMIPKKARKHGSYRFAKRRLAVFLECSITAKKRGGAVYRASTFARPPKKFSLSHHRQPLCRCQAPE